MSNIRGTITSYQGAIPGTYPNQTSTVPQPSIAFTGSIGDETIDPLICGGTNSQTLDVIMFTRYVPPIDKLVSNITFQNVQVVGTPAVYLGIYTPTGARLAQTANVGPLLGVPSQFVVCPLTTPVTLIANTPYYIALLVTGAGTGLRVLHGAGDGSLVFSANYPIGFTIPDGTLGGRVVAKAGQTSLPAQVTGAMTFVNTWVIWHVLT